MRPAPAVRRLPTILLAAAACSGRGGAPAPDAHVFADEFASPAVDRTRWEVYTGTVYNAELQRYVDDTSTVYVVRGRAAEGAEGGALAIHARLAPGPRPDSGHAEFASGRLHGRVRFQYGTVAARMKLPAGAGLWPAFWILGAGAWPDHGEIDVLENVGDPTWVSAALHGPGYSGDTPLLRRDTLPPGRDATAWHVYAVTWTRDSIVFRVDDAPYYRVARADVERHGPAGALDSAKFVVLNLALGGNYPAAVNGVRAPRLGLPDPTVALIRDGRARVLVDWVRVTR